MSFVCSWHLSQKEVRLSTPLILLLGERVGVKERERGERETDTETQRGHGEEIEAETESKDEGGALLHTSRWTIEGHVFKTQMCTALRYWSRSLLVIHIGHPDHEPTPSRLPVRNGAPTLQVEQGPSHGETPP